MLDSLFGGQLGTTAKFAIAFILVLGLIGLTALIIRRFGAGGMPSSGGGRGRQPRLAVLDSAVVDAKRRLVLIRRDNSEHLLLIGGPSDVVVETNIVRTTGPAPMPIPQMQGQPERRPGREARSVPMPAQEPDYESSLVPEPPYEEPTPAPAPAPAPRPQPAAYSPPPPLPPRQPPHPSAAAPAPQPAAAPQQPAPAPQQPQVQTKLDPQYADMAQRLEAALRKPATAPAPKTPDTRPMPQAAQPRPAPMPQTRPMPASPAPAVSQPAPRPGPAPSGQPNPFDSLEAEMASLLGQDKKR